MNPFTDKPTIRVCIDFIIHFSDPEVTPEIQIYHNHLVRSL